MAGPPVKGNVNLTALTPPLVVTINYLVKSYWEVIWQCVAYKIFTSFDPVVNWEMSLPYSSDFHEKYSS